MTVSGLLLLRVTEPYTLRPFRVWLPVPILFCFSGASLLIFSIWEAPNEALLAYGFILSGVPAYFLKEGGKIRTMYLLTITNSAKSFSTKANTFQAYQEVDMELEDFNKI